MKKTFQCLLVCVTSLLIAGVAFAGESYYPLKEGLTWVYQMSIKTSLGGDGSFNVVLKNMPERQLNGKKVVPQQVDAHGNISFSFVMDDETGIYEYAKQGAGDIDPQVNSSPDFYFKNPLKTGTSWTFEGKTHFLQERANIVFEYAVLDMSEVVTVPAGTFKNCVRIKATGNTTKNMGVFGQAEIRAEKHLWYAPDVGLVKLVDREESNNLMLGAGEGTMQLISFKK